MLKRRLLGAATVACLVVAMSCFTMAWRSAGQPHLVPFAASGSVGQAPVGHWNGPPGRSRGARTSPPVKVALPAVGLSARVVPVGLTNARHVKMPRPSVAGWYRPGQASGAHQPTVLVGHVDSDHGPAVFYRLSGVRSGQTVQMTRADGSVSRYVISRLTVVSKSDFPSPAVFGSTRRAVIRLITCTGPFSSLTGYADSLIVWGHDARS